MTNRLKAYRYLENMQQSKLAEILKMPTSTLSGLENDTRDFKGDFSKLGYSDARIEDIPEMSPPLHRHRVSTTVKGKNKATEQLRLAGELYQFLAGSSDHLKSFSEKQYKLPLPSPTGNDQLEEYAVEIREDILQVLHDEPIGNLTKKVENLGICLIPIRVEGIDGLSSFIGEKRQPVIGLSPGPGISGERFRFTLAHEFAHLFLHTTKNDDTEAQANYLAGAILFPYEPFHEAMQSIEKDPSLKNFVLLKRKWKVSVGAMIYRAKELGYITPERFRSLQIQKAP